MKKQLLCILLLMIVFIASGQPFEGKIIYVTKYKSKMPQMTSEEWDAWMGTSQEYYIRNGNYKIVSNGEMFQWQIYINKENKIYNKLANDEKVLWVDCGTNKDQVLKSKINKGVIELFEYPCDELIVNTKNGTQKYYYTSALPADATIFKNHKYANWADYLFKSRSIPLKSIIETDKFIVESIAIKIVPLELDDNLFELPKGTVSEKSP